MTEFLNFIFRHLWRSLPILLAGTTIGAALIAAYYFYFKRKYKGERSFPWWKSVLFLLFLGYLGVLAATTLLGRTPRYAQYANFHLFRAWRDAWNNFSMQSWLNVLINIAMFVPMGLCLPLLSRRLGKWYLVLLIGFGFSGIIEAIQYICGIGLMDVDDLFCNTLGAALGGCLVNAVFALKSPKKLRRKRLAACLALPLTLVLTLAGIFLSYHFKEYGNMILAPSYRQKTQGISIDLRCELASEEKSVIFYKAPELTREASDDFAEAFLKKQGLELEKARYYDDSAWYFASDEYSSLYVNYIDGSSIYFHKNELYEPLDTDFSEAQLRKKLSEIGAHAPEEAFFLRDEENNYLFIVNRLQKDGLMYDGSISCELSREGELLELNNFLVEYESYKEESICSEQEAFEKLKKGKFSGPEWFPGQEPDSYEITDCELQYRVDSKGFYRPVYIFSALAEGHSIGGGLLVLAD